MAPDAEDCETVRLNVEQVPVHHGRRILPDGQPPASAWTENEDERPGDNTNSPGENRRLLPTTALPAKHKSRLQAGLTLGVHNKYPQITKSQKAYAKTKFEKRKDKLIALLKPPYFIVSMIILLVSIFVTTTFYLVLYLFIRTYYLTAEKITSHLPVILNIRFFILNLFLLAEPFRMLMNAILSLC